MTMTNDTNHAQTETGSAAPLIIGLGASAGGRLRVFRVRRLVFVSGLDG